MERNLEISFDTNLYLWVLDFSKNPEFILELKEAYPDKDIIIGKSMQNIPNLLLYPFLKEIKDLDVISKFNRVLDFLKEKIKPYRKIILDSLLLNEESDRMRLEDNFMREISDDLWVLKGKVQ